MLDSVPLKTFASKFARYYPDVNYSKALRWVHANKLPIWPRFDNENIYVRVKDLTPFCLGKGLSQAEIEAFYADLAE